MGLLLPALLFPLITQAQYNFQVTKATGKPEAVSPAGGIYYALPKTIFKVRVVLEQVTEVPGPFAKYASKYLGTIHYIRSKKVYYKLLSVKVEPVVEADPSAVFYVRFPQSRSSKEVRSFGLQLNSRGIITGFGLPRQEEKTVASLPPAPPQASSQMYLFSDHRKGFDMQAGYSRAQKVDTIVRKITIDTVTIKRFLFQTSWVNLSEEDRANDAAKQIKNIRQSRYNLLTGYQEVNYGEGIRYMDTELQNLEHEYLVLFLGREYRQMVVRSFVFDPEKQSLSGKLLQYTDKEGTTHVLSISARITNAMKTIPTAITAGTDAFFYRIPVEAVISVGSGSHPFYSDTFTVPQLGNITSVPVKENTTLRFDPQTGTLTDIEKNRP